VNLASKKRYATPGHAPTGPNVILAAWEQGLPADLGKNGGEMTDLLTPGPRRRHPDGSPDDGRRPLAVSAGSAALTAAGAMLVGCMALALAGWFASDAGSHGDTRDAIRIGADAWLLAHGSHLQLEAATVTAIPLGLTMLCAYVTFRLGRWAGATSAVEDDRAVLTAVGVLAGVYGVVAVVTAVLASLGPAQPSPGRAFVGGFLLAGLFGGAGLLAGSGRWPGLRERVPEPVRCVATATASVVLLMLAAGSLLVTGALLLDLGSAANVLSRLHTDVPGGLLYTVVVAAVAPNASLLAGAYLLGPGFAVGTGTVVSPSAVVLGPVPAFPLLAALPGNGATPAWTAGLVVVPALVAGVAVASVLRRFPVSKYDAGALRGVAAGLLGGVLFALVTLLAGGSVGPGRMSDVGAPLGETLVAAGVAMGVGGLLGGVAMTWWLRRRWTESV
jgi:hypothetical protein